MPIYVVIVAGDHLCEGRLTRLFDESLRHEVANTLGVWFVRSNRQTPSEVVSDLGIKVGECSGVVIEASRYDGVADRALVDKLQVWENPE